MARKLTFEEKYNLIKERSGSTLLKIITSEGKKDRYLLKCGNCGCEVEKGWDSVNNKYCFNCSPSRTLTFEEKVVLLNERNPEVILLSEKRGENNRVYCEYKTEFDETIKIREWSLLISENRTLKDPVVKNKIRREESFEEKKKLLKEKHPDLELIDQFTQYESNQLYHHYKCRCGNILVSKWSEIIKGRNCICCKDTNLYTIEEKQIILDENGIKSKILSQTVNKKGQSVCEFTCDKCGKIGKKLWNNLRLSGCCSECNPNRKYTIKERQKILDDIGSGNKIIREFKKDGDWWIEYVCSCGCTDIKIWEHLREGAHCMSCSGIRRYTFEQRVEILKELNPNITLLSDFIGQGGKSACNYICECGEEKIGDFQHLRLGGLCFSCGCKKNSDKLRFTLEQVKEKLKGINPNIEIIDTEYIDSKTKLKCKCLIDGFEFLIDWNSINQGTGCPKCSSPKGEKRIDLFLSENEINHIPQKQFNDLFGQSGKRKLSYDFYLPDYNTLIEYDGEFHYKIIPMSKNEVKMEKNFHRQQKHDKMKDKYALDNNIKLIRIPYTSFNEIENILSVELKL